VTEEVGYGMFLISKRREPRIGLQGCAATIEVASRGRADGTPGTAIEKRAVIPARQPGVARLRDRAAWLGAGLVAAAHVLRNRRFHKPLAVGGIVLAALALMGGIVLVRVVRDLTAYDDARLADLQRQLHRKRIAQTPDGAVLEGTVIPPPQPGASSRQRRAVLLGVALVAAGRVVRSRRFDEQVIVILFALAALSQMGWKELVRAFRDLIAWDNARLADLEKELRRQHKARVALAG
jgi:hypothetical protein